MTPASDSRQLSRSPGTNSPFLQGQPAATPETASKKKKKGKNGPGRDDGPGKTAPKASGEDINQPSPILEPQGQFNTAQLPVPPVSGNNAHPVLDALESFGTSLDNDTVDRTGAWAQTVPFGKSPPTDLNDGTTFAGSPSSFPSRLDKGGFSRASPSTSPPAGRPRPVSYGAGYPSIAQSQQQAMSTHQRHPLGFQYPNQPPPPHLPQAHFYGAPDIELPGLVGQNLQSPPMGSYSFCAFDTLPVPSTQRNTKSGGKVLLVGSDGTLEVLAVDQGSVRPLGRLEGLNGRVLDAKLLCWASHHDPVVASRPHVAITLHGPVVDKEEGGWSASSGSDPNELVPGLSGRSVTGEKQHKPEDAVYFQTRVEVYSLRLQKQVATLFMSKPMRAFETFPGLPPVLPAPVGNLKIQSSGDFVVVASGVSGEVFIYTADSSAPSGGYRCLAKTWTTVQSRESRRYSSSSSSTDPDGSPADSARGSTFPDRPIFSLGGRWLAVVPPLSSSRVSLQGVVPPSVVQKKCPGLDMHSPPSRPAVTCSVDCGPGESLLNKVARGVTQEIFKGAKWIGDQGMQTWNNYWNREQQQSQPALRRTSHPAEAPQLYSNLFPPTHGQDTQSSSNSEPDLVSIIDLRKFVEHSETRASQASPIATFQTPSGCSFLSFAPSNLMLLTASKNGDVQHVWDLMQIKACRTTALISDDVASPPELSLLPTRVRQVSKYTRLTTSSIVDVIWTDPIGERLAIITRKGTIHVFDLPRSAFQWPPLRRSSQPSAKFQGDGTAKDAVPDETSVNSWSSAMKMVGDRTQPILAAVRGRAPSTGSAFSGVGGFAMSTGAGVRGGKAVAAGLSKSVGAATGTVNHLRHSGDNRLHLSGIGREPRASRVAWFCHQSDPLLGAVDSGILKLYSIRWSTPSQNSRKVHSVIGRKFSEVKLPACLQNQIDSNQTAIAHVSLGVSGVWSLASSPGNPTHHTKLKSQPLSQAEIETNPPYQPFHTDRRVNMNVYTDDADDVPGYSGPWVFGDAIATIKVHVRPPVSSDDEDELASDHQGSRREIENLISLGNNSDDVEHVVITTRRKKKKSSASNVVSSQGDDDGFFEDDCEVLDFARDRV